MNEAVFVEIQRTRDVAWGWWLAAAMAVFFVVLGLRRRSLWVIGMPVLGCFVWFMAVGRMTFEVTPREIRVSGYPINLSRTIPLAALQRYQAVRYRPIQEYGGWGYRISGHGVAYSVDGDRGVQLELVSGERVLLGSQQPDRLVGALDKVTHQRVR